MKRKIQLMAGMILVSIALFLIPMISHASKESSLFAGGDGSVENPYQISTAEHLYNVSKYPEANYILTDNITWSDKFWVPVKIEGVFDGNGYYIENLKSQKKAAGFASRVGASACIKNLELKNVNYDTSNYNFGGIAVNNSGTIENCFISGYIYNSSEPTYIDEGISGGGICYNNTGVIKECVSNCEIVACKAAAGICADNKGIISDCLNLGINYRVSYEPHCGVACTNSGTITNCINLNGSPKSIGVVNKNSGTITNCYYLRSAGYCGRGGANEAGTTRIESYDMMKPESYVNLDFDTIWQISENGKYPILRNNSAAQRNLNDLPELDEPLQNVEVEGYTYNTIRVSWESYERATSYIVVKQIIQDRNQGVYAWGLRDETCYCVSDTVIVDTEVEKKGVVYSYNIIPVIEHQGMKFYGFHTGFGSGRPIDTSSSDSGYNDTKSPIVDMIELQSDIVNIPGALKLNIVARDEDSGIKSVSVTVVDSLGMEACERLFTYTEKYNNKSFLDKTINVPIINYSSGDEFYTDTTKFVSGEEIKAGKTYYIGKIQITDAAGNVTCFNGSMFAGGRVVVKSEFDVEFEGVLSNQYITRELKNMAEGKTVVLKNDEKSKGILKKEILDAIKGQDKTVVVHVDKQGSKQWVFYGKDITGETKNLDLNVQVSKVDGEGYGCNGSLIMLGFANNGELPTGVDFRVKTDFMESLYKLDDSLYLYYLNGKNLELESSECPVIRDGSSYWCYIDMRHNSTFYLSNVKLKNPLIKQQITLETKKVLYNGNAHKPSITVKGLKKDIDYTVSYKNNVKVGKASVIVKGKGKYSGTITKNFVIMPTKVSMLKAIRYQYGNKVNLSWTKVTGATGYRIEYKKSGESKYRFLKATKNLEFIKGDLKENETYSFKVTPYYEFNGTKYYATSPKAYKVISIKTISKGKVLSTVNKPTIKKAGTKVKVTWGNVQNETGYEISKSTSQTGTKIVCTYKTTSGTSKTIAAQKGKTYYYKVRAYRVVGEKKIYGAWSNTVKYTRK